MATSWTSLGGSGDRRGMIGVTGPLAISGMSRPFSMLVSGDRWSGETENFYFATDSSAAGNAVEFSFAHSRLPRVIDGIAFVKEPKSAGSALWSFEGHDGAGWVSLCQFRIDTETARAETTFDNSAAYDKYRMIALSGAISGNVVIYDIEFRIDDTFDEFGIGDRSNRIAVTGTAPIRYGAYENLVAGRLTGTNDDSLTLANTVVGDYLEFAFARAITLKNVYTIASGSNHLAVWKWQRFEPSGWVDISAEIPWDISYGTFRENNGFNRFELDNDLASTRYRMTRVASPRLPDTACRIRAFCFQALPASGPGTDTGDATAELTGAAIVGGELTCAFADNDPDGPASAVAYQWLRGGAEIVGATAATYAPRAADIGATLACRVSYTDAGGTQEAITTAATAPVAPAARRLPAVALDAGAGLAGLLHRGRLVLAAMAAGAELAARVRRMSPYSARLDAGARLSAVVRVDRPLAAAFAAGADLRCRVVAARGRRVAAAFEAAVDHRARLRRLRPREVPVIQSTVIVFAL